MPLISNLNMQAKVLESTCKLERSVWDLGKRCGIELFLPSLVMSGNVVVCIVVHRAVFKQILFLKNCRRFPAPVLSETRSAKCFRIKSEHVYLSSNTTEGSAILV